MLYSYTLIYLLALNVYQAYFYEIVPSFQKCAQLLQQKELELKCQDLSKIKIGNIYQACINSQSIDQCDSNTLSKTTCYEPISQLMLENIRAKCDSVSECKLETELVEIQNDFLNSCLRTSRPNFIMIDYECVTFPRTSLSK